MAHEIVQKEIRKVGGSYYVYSSKGKKLSKGYRSRKDALKRLREIEYFKQQTHKERLEPAYKCFMNDLNDMNDEDDE